MICDLNVGSIPVVVDHHSLALVGVTTDRDLCCRVLAHSLDATSRNSSPTIRGRLVETAKTLSKASSYPRASMSRIPSSTRTTYVIGIISQADLVLKDDAGR